MLRNPVSESPRDRASALAKKPGFCDNFGILIRFYEETRFLNPTRSLLS
ncbi:MAG: hypothetical protein U7126_03425 [Microcoleus sp.]